MRIFFDSGIQKKHLRLALIKENHPTRIVRSSVEQTLFRNLDLDLTGAERPERWLEGFSDLNTCDESLP